MLEILLAGIALCLEKWLENDPKQLMIFSSVWSTDQFSHQLVIHYRNETLRLTVPLGYTIPQLGINQTYPPAGERVSKVGLDQFIRLLQEHLELYRINTAKGEKLVAPVRIQVVTGNTLRFQLYNELAYYLKIRFLDLNNNNPTVK